MQRSTRIASVALLPLLALMGLFGTALGQAQGGEIVFGVNREADMFDLQVGTSRYDLVVAASVFDTYLFQTEQGEYLPWLAEEVTVSEDATVYTMRLRPGVVFHDGTPLDAEAVKFNFDRIVDPETGSRAAVNDMGSYDRTEIVDDLTVRVHFLEPHPAFWTALSDWRAGGPHSPTALRADPAAFRQHPVGTGPFKFVEWIQRDRIVLEAFEEYDWPFPGAQHEGRALPDRVVFRLIPEDQSRVIAVTTGEVDGAMRIPPQSVAQLETNPDTYIVTKSLPGTGVLLVVNGSKVPTNELAVRQAVLHAVNRAQLAQIGYFGTWPVHDGSVLSPTNPYFLDLSAMYPFDIERARALLDEAGWIDTNGNGIRDKNGEEALMKYIGFPNPEATRVVEFLKATLNQIGMDVEIVELDSGAIQKAREDGEHNLAHLTWIFKDPGFMRAMWHSENIGSGFNFTHYPSERLDTLIEDGIVESDVGARRQIYEEIQTLMLEEALVLPTVYQQAIVALRSDVQGVVLYEVYGEAPYFYDATKE